MSVFSGRSQENLKFGYDVDWDINKRQLRIIANMSGTENSAWFSDFTDTRSIERHSRLAGENHFVPLGTGRWGFGGLLVPSKQTQSDYVTTLLYRPVWTEDDGYKREFAFALYASAVTLLTQLIQHRNCDESSKLQLLNFEFLCCDEGMYGCSISVDLMPQLRKFLVQCDKAAVEQVLFSAIRSAREKLRPVRRPHGIFGLIDQERGEVQFCFNGMTGSVLGSNGNSSDCPLERSLNISGGSMDTPIDGLVALAALGALTREARKAGF